MIAPNISRYLLSHSLIQTQQASSTVTFILRSNCLAVFYQPDKVVLNRQENVANMKPANKNGDNFEVKQTNIKPRGNNLSRPKFIMTHFEKLIDLHVE